jgi:hypothetical protein
MNNRFVSTHTAVQTELSRHLFVSASCVNVWQRDRLSVDLFPDASAEPASCRIRFFR